MRKKASVTIYIVVLFIVFLSFSAFVVDGSLTFNSRFKLQNITETTALSAAEEFNYSNMADENEIENKVFNKAKEVFNILSKDGLYNPNIEINVDVNSKTVSLKTKAIAQPFFLGFLGVEKINLNAKASAKSESLSVTSYYGNINWVTVTSAYLSDILSKGSNLRDTAILLPLGNFKSASYEYNSIINFSLIDNSDSKALSLGPGGFVTIKLPTPVVDKSGYDIFIEEFGAKEGYLVFAGIDNDPDNPYTQSNDDGSDATAGISWVNISSCAASDEISENVIFNSSVGDKVYGSCYFDISKCGLSVVKYLRIIDDNEETAFIKDNDNYYKTTLYGESSSAMPGADIDAVTVLNHVKLISPINF